MVIINVKIDNNSKMGYVSDNDNNSLEGNFWDFHNGTHGDYHLPNFSNMKEYVNVLKKYHKTKGVKQVKVISENYKYN